MTIGRETIYDEFYSTAGGSRILEFDYSLGDSLVIQVWFQNVSTAAVREILFYVITLCVWIQEAGQCIVDIYSIQVSTIVPQPVNSFDWVVLATFGDTGINSITALQAGGWTTEGINDYQVCGLAGCSAGWCGSPCTGSQEYAGFWCGGSCSGSISYPLPSGYNRGVITVGMTFHNPNCHGTVRFLWPSFSDATICSREKAHQLIAATNKYTVTLCDSKWVT